MKILGISGSLRTNSYNTKLLEISQDIFADDHQIDIFSLCEIPLYNADLDTDAKPVSVTALIDAIASCDVVLFATPEYNYSISGVLKNAIDWASRPAYESVLAGKPAGILSASRGPVGGARAQSQLRHVLAATLTPVLPQREYLLPFASEAFDESGNLLGENMTRRLERYICQLIEWAKDFQVI
ncbi:NADPH-dependent FMN reductase [Desulfamplus magnetovallimortis]|uniref:NADPH-dependent FMN reductase n=1 Tax=Desulfamplus magnetovallimortis TaxID=1246637 RepID=A0A1W1HJK1_9BACT|nr:NAD(P)H-dependent oxidoreductase [Desulfamplus magnetovallimortis]SLM32585.1 NADPH-dependent FMN reductase [Desulfamplus magnetovallimortis]